MILKILEKGSTKVYAPDDQVADYLFLGFTDTGTTTEVVITDPSKEIVEMKIEDDTVTAFRYKGDPVWRSVAGGGGGTDTYKVKVDGTDTADYLENKLQQGTNVTITKSGGKLVVNSTGGSGGAGVTVYADLATLKAVDTTAVTDVQTVQVKSLGLYKFQPASTLTGDDVNVITPTTGSSAGRWILQSTITVPSSTTASQTWSEIGRPLIKIGAEVPKLLKTAQGKKILGFGSSVMFGLGLTTPATQSYFAQQVAELTGYTGKNFSISGETTGSGLIRFHQDVMAENPDYIWFGYSPNNNSLSTKTTDADCANAINLFEKDLDNLTKCCEQIGVPYIITGVYPKNDFTVIAYKYLKKLNINLSLKYGTRYLNVLGSLDNGDGTWKASLVQADGTHPNLTGATLMKNCIVPSLFTSNRANLQQPILNDGNGVKLGADITTLNPMKTFANSVRNQSFSRYLEIYKDSSNSITGKVLWSIVPSNATRIINIVENSSGYIDILNESSISILASASTVKMKEGFNKIFITHDIITGLFALWCNGVKVGNTTAVISFYFSYDSIGGGTTAASNATNVEYRNFACWCTKLTDDEIITISNGIMLCGGLDYFNSFASTPNGVYYNDGGATINTRVVLQSTLWTSGVKGTNTYTDTEKQKLANNTTGTFTTADGKTITITGGMVTSIV